MEHQKKMLFSVVIPLYNKALYIERAVRSVLNQTFTDFELIVVDDGSTDGGTDIAEKLLSGSAVSHKLIRKSNGGVSSARNAGIEASQGRYVCFLDGDDWWSRGFLERIKWLIDNYPDAGLYCSNFYYVKHGKNNVKLDIPTGYYNYCREYARTLCMSATSSSSCVCRDILDEFGGFKTNLKLGEDFHLWVRIALKYGAAIINEPLAYYFNDLPAEHRATHHLYKPENHILWNLSDLEPQESTNTDYKRLVDRLRVNGLLSYFLTKEYREAARAELAKVDWNQQNPEIRSKYAKPLLYLRAKSKFMSTAARIKKLIIQIVR